LLGVRASNLLPLNELHEAPSAPEETPPGTTLPLFS
jgi:hypothetical protein